MVFPADEGINATTEVDTFISVGDDTIDEIEEQVFVVLLEVVNATNPQLLNIERDLSVCRIIDNDRKSTCS